jgi:nitrite reductase/ring-hydroxylating ferredoxin subunit
VVRLGLALAVVAACAQSQSSDSIGDVPAGNKSALTVGSVVVVTGSPVCIARDEAGVYAMTLICTHESCDMTTDGTVSASRIVCRCHGSVFDPNGAVVHGPARSALEHFAVTADAAGNLTIHGGTVVGADVRLAV